MVLPASGRVDEGHAGACGDTSTGSAGRAKIEHAQISMFRRTTRRDLSLREDVSFRSNEPLMGAQIAGKRGIAARREVYSEPHSPDDC